jgi:hypothetical protein
MGCGKKKFRNTPLVNNPVYKCYLPELIDPRTSRNMPIRDIK